MYKACTIKKHFVYWSRILKLNYMAETLSKNKGKLMMTSASFSISDVFFMELQALVDLTFWKMVKSKP